MKLLKHTVPSTDDMFAGKVIALQVASMMRQYREQLDKHYALDPEVIRQRVEHYGKSRNGK